MLEGNYPRYLAPRMPEFLLRETKIEAGQLEPSLRYKVSVRNNGCVQAGQHMLECVFCEALAQGLPWCLKGVTERMAN